MCMRTIITSTLIFFTTFVAFAQEAPLPPWENNSPESVLPRGVPESPRALLSIFGFTDADFAAFDGLSEITPQAEPTVTRLLFELPKMKREHVAQWAKDQPLNEIGAENRFEFFAVQGVTTELKVVPLEAGAAERLGFNEYLQINVTTPDTDRRAVLITRFAPAAWRTSEPENGVYAVNQPVEFTGLYIAGEESTDPLYFVATEARWLPTEPSKELGVSADQVLLASLGVDIGGFDRMSALKLGKTDREPFYEMLAAVEAASSEQLNSGSSFELVELLREPEKQHGRLLNLRGEARKVTKVIVEEEDIRERFGIDHYWQIDMFIALPAGQKIKLDPGENAPVYTREFPATLCVREIPDLWKQELGDKTVSGALITDKIAAPAFFFKLWAFRSEYVEQHDRTHQVAPMLIGRAPRIIREESRAGDWIAIGGGFVFFLVIAGFWFAYWRYSKADKKFEQETLNRQFDLEEGQSLNEMGIEASDGPDFSNLE